MPLAAPASEQIADATHQAIRNAIIFGRLAPGTRLRLDAMRSAYGTSISTLRENLHRLSSEGLVTAMGQKGFAVAPVSLDELREIAEMRLLLEQHAIALSFPNGDLEWEGRIVAAHHKLARLEKRLLSDEAADPAVWKRYDWEFHHSLISACGSSELLEIHAGIYDKYLRYQMVVGIFRGEIAAREHERLLAAALDRRVTDATAILTTHIQGCVEDIAQRQVLPHLRKAA